MALYSVKRKPWDEELPSPKEPVAASAVVPVGNTYAVMPIGGGSPQQEPQQFLKSPPVGDTPSHPAATPAAPQPVGYDDPILENLRKSIEALHQSEMAPVQKQNRLKSFLKMAGYALSQTQGGNTWADVARQAGSALGGGIAGAAQPKLPGAVKKLYDIQKKEEDVTRAEKYAGTASNIVRRDELTRQGQQRIGLAQEKATLDAQYKAWLMKKGDRAADSSDRRQKFIEETQAGKFARQDAQDEWKQEVTKEKMTEQKRQFDASLEIKKRNTDLSARRTAAYETSVKQTGDKIKAQQASDAEEVKALSEQNDQYEAMIQVLDPTDDASEVNKLQGAIIANQKVIAKKGKGEAPQAGASGQGSLTPESLKGMSEQQFRAYYSNASPKPTQAQLDAAVKRWKKRYGKY